MSSTDVTSDSTTEVPETGTGDMKLEAVVLPVSDVDRAKKFYEMLGWRLDADFATGANFRIVQFTPPGSPASIHFGTGVTNTAPGSIERVVLVVEDVEEARAELVARGVDVSEVFHGEDDVLHHAGTGGRVPGPDPNRSSYGSGASFRRSRRQCLAAPGDHRAAPRAVKTTLARVLATPNAASSVGRAADVDCQAMHAYDAIIGWDHPAADRARLDVRGPKHIATVAKKERQRTGESPRVDPWS